MARLLALLAAPAAALAAPTATLLWQQGEPDATYTSAAVSLHGASAAPTFATATSGLDSWPVVLEVYNVSSGNGGSVAWQYAAAADNATSFFVAMARHTEGTGAGAVDTVIIEGDKDAASDVWLRGFASLGAGAPAWSLRVPNVRLASGLAVADDGSAAVVPRVKAHRATAALHRTRPPPRRTAPRSCRGRPAGIRDPAPIPAWR